MAEVDQSRTIGNKEKNRYKIILLILSCVVLIFLLAVSISVGAADIHLSTVWNAVLQFDSNIQAHQIIQEIRLPRSIGACLIGACLAVSGAILQALTRNPLADSSIMGVTSGAALALIIVLVFFPALSMGEQSLASFVGAGFGVLIVFGIGAFSKGSVSPAKLALAGVAVSSLFQAITTAIALHFDMAKNMGFWYAGGLNKVNWSGVHILFIVCMAGIAAAILISKALTILSLGEDVSKGLGQNTLIIKAIGFVITLFLTGAAVSVAGPIGFIGLVVPHITRFLIGPDYRWVIPFSAIFGAILLVLSDTAARMVNAPFETPAGVITAIVGVPFFLYLARGERRRA
ncbi:iron ABC transporter permease [Niallia sp. NCCP-28]|uniref:FecCD family ABC transporter permease n=1 Tax=Niallia sp. NCCP-28 TaxID=2934712 RepID=UPI002087AD38|nr:iron ABC transporter permease [Niallia sp. NCCP-28]GKU84542.1 iron(3+)-hydroxamate import system permease protein FhuB [Niallia sp. NCCP-28]